MSIARERDIFIPYALGGGEAARQEALIPSDALSEIRDWMRPFETHQDTRDLIETHEAAHEAERRRGEILETLGEAESELQAALDALPHDVDLLNPQARDALESQMRLVSQLREHYSTASARDLQMVDVRAIRAEVAAGVNAAVTAATGATAMEHCALMSEKIEAYSFERLAQEFSVADYVRMSPEELRAVQNKLDRGYDDFRTTRDDFNRRVDDAAQRAGVIDDEHYQELKRQEEEARRKEEEARRNEDRLAIARAQEEQARLARERAEMTGDERAIAEARERERAATARRVAQERKQRAEQIRRDNPNLSEEESLEIARTKDTIYLAKRTQATEESLDDLGISDEIERINRRTASANDHTEMKTLSDIESEEVLGLERLVPSTSEEITELGQVTLSAFESSESNESLSLDFSGFQSGLSDDPAMQASIQAFRNEGITDNVKATKPTEEQPSGHDALPEDLQQATPINEQSLAKDNGKNRTS